jgi:hypothetical protein
METVMVLQQAPLSHQILRLRPTHSLVRRPGIMLCELLRPGYRTLELSYEISPPDVRIVDRLPILLVPGVSDRGQTIR